MTTDSEGWGNRHLGHGSQPYGPGMPVRSCPKPLLLICRTSGSAVAIPCHTCPHMAPSYNNSKASSQCLFNDGAHVLMSNEREEGGGVEAVEA